MTGPWHKQTAVCKCDCGKTIEEIPNHLIKRRISCGCSSRDNLEAVVTTHGNSQKPCFNIWRKMIFRCHDKLSKDYQRYGGRGISVCKRWRYGQGGRHGYDCFMEDVGERPSKKHSIDRKNNLGPYCKSNCKWVTSMDQGANKRNNILMTFNGKTQHLSAWARELSIRNDTLRHRFVVSGWSAEKAITTPVK